MNARHQTQEPVFSPDSLGVDLLDEIVFEAMRNVVRDDYPETPWTPDPDEFCAASDDELWRAATAAACNAGINVADPDVDMAIEDAFQGFKDLIGAASRYGSPFSLDHREERAAWNAIYRNEPATIKPRQACSARWRSAPMRGRSRAARRGAGRRAGSRRVSRAPPSDGDDPDPPGLLGTPPARRQTAGMALI
jgi:hypothetical protein